MSERDRIFAGCPTCVLRVVLLLLIGLGLLGAWPGAARAATGWDAYVANHLGNTVTPFATATNLAGPPITSGSGPHGVAVTPDGATAYVTNFYAGTLTPISTATNTAGAPITVGGEPAAIAITPDGRTAYVTDYSAGTVTPVSLASHLAGPSIPVGADPGAVAITPDGRTAYVANGGDTTVTPISTATNLAGPPINVPGQPGGIAVTPDGRTAYVANFGVAEVTPINTATNTAGSGIPVSSPYGQAVAITPDGGTAYAVNGNSVTPISTATNTPGAAIGVGSQPKGIAITPDGRTAYVANSGDNTVTPINLATDTAGAAIAVGPGPLDVAITPDQAPTAAFSVSPGRARAASTFDGSASSSPTGSVVSYRWDFGDGQSAVTSTPQASHVYARAGFYLASLTVTDSAGTSTTQVFTGHTVSRNGGPRASSTKLVSVGCPAGQSGSPCVPPASLSRVGESHARWREGGRGGRHRPPLGTTFTFRLNEVARVSFAFTQPAAGRRVKGRCVAPNRRNRRQRACRRMLTRATLTIIGRAGANRLVFKGRIPHRAALKPGRYTVVIRAINSAGQKSTPQRLTFTIVR